MPIKYDIKDGRNPPFDIFSSKWKNIVSTSNSPDFPILKPQPFEMNSHELSFSDMSYTNHLGKYVTETSRSYIGSAGEPSGPQKNIADLKQLSMNSFLDHCASIRVNLIDLYRTRIESANMVTSKMRTLYNAYTCLRKGKFRQFKRTLGITGKRPQQGWDNIPKLWLEYSFGWMPLLGDCHTILNKTFEPPSLFVRRVYRYTIERHSEQGRDGTSVNSGKCTAYWTVEYRGVTTGLVTVDAPAVQAIAQYGINNPTAAIWEAIPFSFVVDWFVPIGDYLDKLGSTAGLKFRDCSTTCTTYVRGGASYRKYTYGPDGNGKNYYRTGSHRFSYKYKKRFVETPKYAFGKLSGPLDQSLTRFSYALALLSSIFGGKR